MAKEDGLQTEFIDKPEDCVIIEFFDIGEDTQLSVSFSSLVRNP